MKKRPNAIWHMTSWGTVIGTILAMSYIIVLTDFQSAFVTRLDLFTAMISPGLCTFAFLFWGIPGAVLGFFNGVALDAILREVPIPFTRTEMHQKSSTVYASIFSLTLILSILLMNGIFGISFAIFSDWILPLVAAIIASYLAYRYMLLLRIWSATTKSRKMKMKNDTISRLSDEAIEDETLSIDMLPAEKQDYMR